MLIKKRFLNTKVKILTGVMATGLFIGGSLLTLPTAQAKSVVSDDYPLNDSINWNLNPVWRDEFNGASLDKDSWNVRSGGWGANHVQSCYRDKEENVNVKNGSLNLVGLYKPGERCSGNEKSGNFTSGFVETKGKRFWTYGYIEARIKMPNNKSTWPAFWMSPNEKRYGDGWPMNGEIDIVETKGSDLDYAAADAHWGKSITNKTHKNSHKSDLPAGFSNTTDWHTYGVKWTEGKLEYFIDGKSYHTVEGFGQPNAANTPHGPFDVPFFLRLNMAIGGTYIDGPGGKWSNAYNVVAEEPGTFPATMSVDYVRVYQKREPKEVEVKDTELRKLLNEKLGEKLGTARAENQKITDVELEKLTDLNLDNSNITNLTGIEAAKNLKNLSLNHNSISNLSPLSSLTSLRTLSLKENAITDISPLAGLTSLTSLHLEDQRANVKPNDKSFVSPMRDITGSPFYIYHSEDVINDTETIGKVHILSLPANGASPILNVSWVNGITVIGRLQAVFSGTLAIDTSAIPRAVQPQPQPQPQPGNPSAAAHNPANKPQNAVSGLLANTGFNVFLGVIATLALVAAGLLILR